MKAFVFGVLFVATGVASAGLIMNYGRNLPVIRQARQGFIGI